eukprot:2139252-Prymnesium_polylepis.1
MSRAATLLHPHATLRPLATENSPRRSGVDRHPVAPPAPWRPNRRSPTRIQALDPARAPEPRPSHSRWNSEPPSR